MKNRPNKARVNIPMCCACILLCLTLFSFHLCGGLYAKYTASGQGSDSARVIKFSNITITETGDFYEANKLMIIPGVDIKKEAKVNFKGSEAATYVFVKVTQTAAWSVEPGNKAFSLSASGKELMSWQIADGWDYLADTQYVYYRTLEPNQQLNDVDIIKDGKINVSADITKGELGALGDVAIGLRATVVQATGFENAAAAWASVSAKGG